MAGTAPACKIVYEQALQVYPVPTGKKSTTTCFKEKQEPYESHMYNDYDPYVG